MRDRSVRRRSRNYSHAPGRRSASRSNTGDKRHRVDVLRELADGAHALGWTRGLVNALLDELHVTDEFDRLVGPTSHVPASQFPRLIAIALLLRHSWSLDDLSRTGQRVGLGVGPLEADLTTFGCDCSQRCRRSSRTSLSGPRPAPKKKSPMNDMHHSPALPRGHRVRELVFAYRSLRGSDGRVVDVPSVALNSPRNAATVLTSLIADQLVEVFGVACLSPAIASSPGICSHAARVTARQCPCRTYFCPRVSHRARPA